MIYGYARVSAKTQLKGNSLQDQKKELKKYGCQEIIEEQFSGKTTICQLSCILILYMIK